MEKKLNRFLDADRCSDCSATGFLTCDFPFFLIIAVVAAIGGLWWIFRILAVGAGARAKMTASYVFLSRRSQDHIKEKNVSHPVHLPGFRTSIDTEKKTVTSAYLGLIRKTAQHVPAFGAVLGSKRSLERLASHSKNVPLPSPSIELPNAVSFSGIEKKLNTAIDSAFEEPDRSRPRNTKAVIVARSGRILAQRYADQIDPHTPVPGWSMTKSIMNALFGILAAEDFLKPEDPAPVALWQKKSDPRRRITVENLLRMNSGLQWDEKFSKPRSDTTVMLFDCGDAAGYAARKHLAHPVGKKWWYSSGTTNLLSSILRTVLASDRAYHKFPREKLFELLQMNSAVLETDQTGTFLGSSFMFASCHDWVRFGTLYQQDGVYNNRRILPEGWVQFSTSPTSGARLNSFGAHFWINGDPNDPTGPRPFPSLPTDILYAWGHEEQYLTIVPSYDATILRIGATPRREYWDHETFLGRILEALK